MTTTTTTTTISNATTATMNAWINDVCAAIFTTLGVTQTADTGQVWSSGGGAVGTLPGAAHTAAGYVVGRFNDTSQGTAPIFFKLEFGSGSAIASPFMWITMGTASNGSGTLTNPSTRVACGADYAWPVSTATNYTSYFCYNTTYGFLGVVLKMGAAAAGSPGVAGMGFMIFRGSTTTGAVNTDATVLLTASATALGPTAVSGSTNANSVMQCWSVAKAAYYPATSDSINDGTMWFLPPIMGYGGFISGSNPTVFPAFYTAPALSITNLLGLVNNSDVSVGTTLTSMIIGSTTLTYINLGGTFGSNSVGKTAAGPSAKIGAILNGNVGDTTSGANSFGIAMLWM